MRKLISCGVATSVLLALGFSAQASQGTAMSAASQVQSGSGSAILLAQADKPAGKPAAAAPAEKKEVKKKPERKREPTRKEMDEVRRHVPAEYHHYLPKGRN